MSAFDTYYKNQESIRQRDAEYQRDRDYTESVLIDNMLAYVLNKSSVQASVCTDSPSNKCSHPVDVWVHRGEVSLGIEIKNDRWSGQKASTRHGRVGGKYCFFLEEGALSAVQKCGGSIAFFFSRAPHKNGKMGGIHALNLKLLVASFPELESRGAHHLGHAGDSSHRNPGFITPLSILDEHEALLPNLVSQALLSEWQDVVLPLLQKGNLREAKKQTTAYQTALR